jgi:hypothetical protein
VRALYNNHTEQLRKYEQWIQQKTIETAYANLPKQVIALNKRLKHGKQTIDEIRTYLKEITGYQKKP